MKATSRAIDLMQDWDTKYPNVPDKQVNKYILVVEVDKEQLRLHTIITPTLVNK